MIHRRDRAALRVGDRVRYDNDEHVVTGLSGTTVRLLADRGAESVQAITRLQLRHHRPGSLVRHAPRTCTTAPAA